MNGNFSFGDYFKEGAIMLAWELITMAVDEGGFGLDPDNLWATVFHGDHEAERIWHEKVGLPKDRIVRRGMADSGGPHKGTRDKAAMELSECGRPGAAAIEPVRSHPAAHRQRLPRLRQLDLNRPFLEKRHEHFDFAANEDVDLSITTWMPLRFR